MLTVDNTPPVVTLTAPTTGAVFNQGDAVNFAATATDYEDGDITVNLTWGSCPAILMGCLSGQIDPSVVPSMAP